MHFNTINFHCKTNSHSRIQCGEPGIIASSGIALPYSWKALRLQSLSWELYIYYRAFKQVWYCQGTAIGFPNRLSDSMVTVKLSISRCCWKWDCEFSMFVIQLDLCIDSSNWIGCRKRVSYLIIILVAKSWTTLTLLPSSSLIFGWFLVRCLRRPVVLQSL